MFFLAILAGIYVSCWDYYKKLFVLFKEYVLKPIILFPVTLCCYSLLLLSCDKNKDEMDNGKINLQLSSIKIGITYLNISSPNDEIPVDKNIIVTFSNALDTSTIKENIILTTKADNLPVGCNVSYADEFRSAILIPYQSLNYLTGYQIEITSDIKGKNNENFPGVVYSFTTVNGKMIINSVTINNNPLNNLDPLHNVSWQDITIKAEFSHSLNPADYQSYFTLSGNIPLNFSVSADSQTVTITNINDLEYYHQYFFNISNMLKANNGFSFNGFSASFYTSVDSAFKFPLMTDDELLGIVQQQTFRYFYDFAHPSCGLARERNTSGDIVTIGGSGFGVMILIVGMEREFISRSEGINRLDNILKFLETCDRYHGAWPHWLNGSTGKTVPFSPIDDGGDLVETSFMIQGLLTMRQYLDSANTTEKSLIDRINVLCNEVEYDWFTRGEDVLYWHWSPNTGWKVNLKIQGYNETLITYVLAASSATHEVSADVYRIGYTQNGLIANGKSYFGYTLPLGQDYGGPLFFTHYSFLGLDPRNLQDDLANYWEQNVNQSLINHAYCVANPNHYVGYGTDSWGLTASDDPWGYSAHSPTNDLGVITPTAAISSLPYTPIESMNAIKHFYYILGDRLWGEYGFYDAFNVTEGWWANSYIAIDQGPIICMIENYRTGLLWSLFMSCPEIQEGLDKLGFRY
jgi:hypothetical protein